MGEAHDGELFLRHFDVGGTFRPLLAGDNLIVGRAGEIVATHDSGIPFTLAGNNTINVAGAIQSIATAFLGSASVGAVDFRATASSIIGSSRGNGIQVNTGGNTYGFALAGELYGTSALVGVGGNVGLTNTGTISGSLTAVSLTGGDVNNAGNAVYNVGTILGGSMTVNGVVQRGFGVYFDNNISDSLVNDGVIQAPNAGVRFDAVSNTLVNNGTIAGGVNGAILSVTGTDTITNNGLITGDVTLNAGDDLYDGEMGRVVGTVKGGAGSDLLIGGSVGARLDGGSENDTLIGNGGADVLVGGGGIDEMFGGIGNDNYVVDNAGDRVIEYAGDGYDRVDASVSYSLAGQELESLRLTGIANSSAGGNALANLLIGNSGNNVLNGNVGADEMRGGLGNDHYIVDQTGDRVIEFAGEGIDSVESSVSFSTGSQQIEIITLTGGGATNATGIRWRTRSSAM